MRATGTAPILPLAPTASVKLPSTFLLSNRVMIEGTLRQGAKGDFESFEAFERLSERLVNN